MKIATKKRVVDATEPLTVRITSADVRSGAKKSPSTCAAAKALCRTAHVDAAQVYVGRTYVLQGKTWTRYRTPRSLRTEIIAFDRGGAFAPGEYTLMPATCGKRFRTPKEKREREAYLEQLRIYNATPARKREKAAQEKKRQRIGTHAAGFHYVRGIRQRAGQGPA
jgi:hypothetical protein